ncbi:MAG: FAD-dependent monooxygenase [Mycobacterium kyogaense]|uniref:FAD-dependent monooxygenase n=1 Tax=Mycobacterium kyogaense TaxID=2212479 RepID=UPI002FFADDBC
MRALISGASIAGPVTAFWLARHGVDVTVVEQAPALRKTGGHAVDLFRPAMEISDRMGLAERVLERATGTHVFEVHRPWRSHPARIDYRKLIGVMSDRHVEIMRDDLSQIYYEASRDYAEYRFGDRITSIADDGTVTFEHARPEAFDIVIGADGLHSGVRRLTFGDDVVERFLGGYLSVVSVPKAFAREGEMVGVYEPRRIAMVYTADHLDDARAVFFFRPEHAVDYDHRDGARQRELLRAGFAGMGAAVDRWLAELDSTPAFYFDAITQLQMDTWTRGRVTLVGDAGYCPGPGVGGSTSLAVYGAYALATELARCDDPAVAFRAYEDVMRAPVLGSRSLAQFNMKTIVPTSRWGVNALVAVGRLITVAPGRLTRMLVQRNDKGVRLYETMPLPAATAI